MVKERFETFGRIDVLINNAGIGRQNSIRIVCCKTMRLYFM